MSRPHRGMHPGDTRAFCPAHHVALRKAAEQLGWLLSRGYNETAALKLVGDRHALTARQRKAVYRCACSDAQLTHRRATRLPPGGGPGRQVHVDGFNQLIVLESALGGGVVLRGRDGCHRDLASVHGSYRRVQDTDRAIELLGTALHRLRPAAVTILLDSPVSNSGRLKLRMTEAARASGWNWTILLHHNPDRELVRGRGVVVSGDGWILDNCSRGWLNLLEIIIAEDLRGTRLVSLG